MAVEHDAQRNLRHNEGGKIRAGQRAELRGEMAQLRAELKIEMAEGFQRQIKWMVGSMIGLFTAFSAVAGVLLAIFK